MSSNCSATIDEKKDEVQDSSKGNDVLSRDLEIEVFSSTELIDLEKCLESLRKIQRVYDVFREHEEEVQNKRTSLESDLLDHQILIEKENLKSSENLRLLTQVKKEKDNSQARYDKSKSSEEASIKERKETEPLHEDLQKQSQDIEALNHEIVTSEFEKRHLQLDVVLDELKALKKDIEIQSKLLDDIFNQYKSTESSYENKVLLLKEKKTNLKEMNDELKSTEKKKEIEQAKKSLHLHEEELKCMKSESTEIKRKLHNEESKFIEIDQVQNNINNQLQEIQKKYNDLDDKVASLSKSLSVVHSDLHSNATTRMQLEIDLRETNESFRHENATLTLHRKQLERMKRIYLKKRRIIEKTNELIQQMKVSQNESAILITDQKMENEKQINAIDKMKDEMNVKITRLMEQQSVEEDVKQEFDSIISAIEKEEYGIDYWRTEVKKLSKIVSVLNIQHEMHARKTRSVVSNEKETLEMIKLKTFVVMDMKKVFHETKKRVMEFSALYDILKGERNEIEGAISTAVLALVEIQKKVDDHKETLQNLHQSQELKKLILVKEQDAHNNSKISRANLRVEKTKLRTDLRQKQDETDRQVLQIAKLKSTLSCLQKESTRLKIRNGTLENGKRLIAEQLEDKKVEIHKLLQRANAYEEALKKGELAIQQKQEDIRVLKLQCANIERYISVKKIVCNDVIAYREKIEKLEDELQIQRKQVQTLSCQIEDPMQSDRWRKLGGEDLDDEQLDAKISVLVQRLSEGKEQLIEREVLLEDIKTETFVLQKNMKMRNKTTQPMIKRLNEYQNRLRDVTRSMMALVSELSMYQAISLKLEEEREQQEESLHQSQQLMKEGKAPSNDALKDLKRLLREKKNNSYAVSAENFYDGFNHVYYPANYALRTTAKPRPSAYIPDSGIEIPKPYGAMAPFKPSDFSGTTMRRMCPPNVNESSN